MMDILIALTEVFWTGGAMNPARALGPFLITRSFPTYSWIYFAGPFAGSGLAVIFYKLIKVLEYESAQGPSEELEMDEVARRGSCHCMEAAELKHGAMGAPGPQGPPGVCSIVFSFSFVIQF